VDVWQVTSARVNRYTEELSLALPVVGVSLENVTEEVLSSEFSAGVGAGMAVESNVLQDCDFVVWSHDDGVTNYNLGL
jgi:hypothetical protein